MKVRKSVSVKKIYISVFLGNQFSYSKNNLHFKYKKSHEDDRKNIYGI